ncbi:4-amino-4-deoxy-L-arabinose transferase-like glycosyltransferase [Microbacterium endophyticum]|uniref:4-amino-4-deoxy-L-arabinose transferase-like glycosyltransferase n=1 Tax=Microbacterium endophyticum TaxID=1526412 RepID=A0A7W4V424_9MICO|nr:glycosyltransferase family 39 protein [Microbacterium endophyticum]MBB2976334.1 4-amino-4-deoxy-L-arabinose transferase-like glycosyltransferase [Microbacterium endophyticum]NIK35214.1 4-amino-4-deoxy-L-arabinose transferase-like glycosyltransferase [Microbacterium endophyticum]
MNSVLRLMQDGGWPAPKSAPMLEGTAVASREAGHPISGEADDPLPSASERSVISDKNQPSSPEQTDWMTQHPPAYYTIVAGTLTALGANEWRWDQLLLGMRLVSAASAALAVPFVAGSVRRITRSRAAGVLGGALLLAIPQYHHVLSLVTNDALATFLGAALMYIVVRAMTKPKRVIALSLVGGAVLGVALLTKGLLLAAIPLVFIGFLVAGWRAYSRPMRRLLPAAVTMALAFAIGGWWWLRNLIVYGVLQPSVFGSGIDEEEPSDAYSLSGFFLRVGERLNETMWGSFRAELDLPVVLTTSASIVAILSIVCALAFSRRRLALAVLLLYPLATMGIITFHAWEIFWDNGTIRGIQGRYLYGGLTALAVSLGMCWTLLFRRVTPWLRAAVAGLIMFAGLCAGIGGWVFGYRVLWSESGVDAMLASGAVTSVAFAIAICVYAIAGLIAVVAVVVCAREKVLSESGPAPVVPQ